MNTFKAMLMVFATLLLVSFATSAQADSHNKIRVFGTVESVDVPKNVFVVLGQDGTKTSFTVDARSEFEVEPADRSKRDFNVPFSELKAGDKVKVKAYPAAQQGNPLIDEVEIYR